MNYFNSSVMDGKAGLRAGVGVDPQSRPKKSGKAEPGVLGASLL